MKHRIHIFGASGSGTTTIAQAVCERLNYRHFDTDTYYWYPTQDPFTEKRPIDERLRLLRADLSAQENWILSGSLDGWGDPLIALFELAVFVYVPQELRIERIKKREAKRYGNDVLPGGSRYAAMLEFIEWAGTYDSGTSTGRNLPRHEAWMENLPCDLLRIVNHSLADSVEAVIAHVEE